MPTKLFPDEIRKAEYELSSKLLGKATRQKVSEKAHSKTQHRWSGAAARAAAFRKQRHFMLGSAKTGDSRHKALRLGVSLRITKRLGVRRLVFPRSTAPSQSLSFTTHIGALIIRIALWGPLRRNAPK